MAELYIDEDDPLAAAQHNETDVMMSFGGSPTAAAWTRTGQVEHPSVEVQCEVAQPVQQLPAVNHTSLQCELQRIVRAKKQSGLESGHWRELDLLSLERTRPDITRHGRRPDSRPRSTRHDTTVDTTQVTDTVSSRRHRSGGHTKVYCKRCAVAEEVTPTTDVLYHRYLPHSTGSGAWSGTTSTKSKIGWIHRSIRLLEMYYVSELEICVSESTPWGFSAIGHIVQ
eukprot:4964642-Prymnesium_polylepis.2